MGIFNRLGDVLRSYLTDDNGDDGWQGRTPFDTRFSDPYEAEAYEELEDYLKGGGKNSGAWKEKASGAAPSGGYRSEQRLKEAAGPPEALRSDFAELGVEFGADAERCKAAYKRLVKIHHPDRHAGHEGNMKKATAKSARLNAAYGRIIKWRETGRV
jgi:DnaJ-domain-containing protein 1